MPFPRAFARFNRRVPNRFVRLFAGWLPPLCVVTHRGRVSGRSYSTPVLGFRSRDGLVVALFYGARSDWVRNVLAAGRVEVRRLGATREYTRPRLLGVEEGARLFPPVLRGSLRFLGVRHCLALTSGSPD